MTSAFLATGKTPSRAGYAIILALIGIGWGSTQPLGKIAASTGHGAFGLIFWQLLAKPPDWGLGHLARLL